MLIAKSGLGGGREGEGRGGGFNWCIDGVGGEMAGDEMACVVGRVKQCAHWNDLPWL